VEFELDTAAIQRLMMDRSLSRLDVARALGVTPAVVRSLEVGRNSSRLTLPIISKLAHILGVDARGLIVPRVEKVEAPLTQADDHIKLEAALAIVRRGATRAELSEMLGWKLKRLDAAIRALDLALDGRGQRLHRLSASRLSLRPAEEALTSSEQHGVRRLITPREGLRLNEAELLTAVMRGQVTTRSRQLSKTNVRGLLGSLMNRSLVRLNGARYELTADAREALLVDEFAGAQKRRGRQGETSHLTAGVK
jgi:transcriptional regulator with XRE-family HTH domain